MKDILTIIFRLTLSCMLAGTVIGGTYIFTKNAKAHNAHVTEQKVRYALLGYQNQDAVPASVALHTMYRYVVSEPGKQYIGYLLPMKEGAEAPYLFLLISLDGKFVESFPMNLTSEAVLEDGSRAEALAAVLGAVRQARFADQTTIATDSGARMAYLLEGKFQGFKTFIKVMLAIDPHNAIMGLEILEHEEDPGLGAEITQDYFRKQFNKKSLEVLTHLGVVKEPLPVEYQNALEGRVDRAAVESVMDKYKDHDIYALTGATISSNSVTTGVKAIVRKFVYRLRILDGVLKAQQLQVAF
ncbi:FMN-binding protein [Desulfotalea psychrophila]|uniref:Related to Na-translocating NADH-quinone reductase (RnfG/NqrC) n=1 Tax=Desulfotalea psychrophila (strain LSv54 / DSM 12343) TaxID=177439 RepID=Q6AQ72_DESPS|nr:FMN-binding protein [Desulfotalea psychrophila]CAG35501.1 related to Na-translocating NADH-quinone reductase (RnfG/NqrC) [Desulfotalea psychrophila LSv54]